MKCYNNVSDYIDQWQRQGHFWAKECEGTTTQRRQADELYPEVLCRLNQLGRLQRYQNPRLIWDYCVGDYGSDPVAEIIDELEE